ncbi:MAG: protein kinase [Gemmatimonadaceae bacterium]|nr:protein kinase [Gemmatimonadaceae bacterium]
MDAGTTNTERTDDTHADPLRDALVSAVGEEYEVVRLIGRGGMGAVYLARDRALERLVAIKVLPPGSATDSGVIERFRREAKTVASLQHVGIVPLYAFGERRGLCWFVMGYVRGESLSARLERDQVLDPETTRTLLAQVAEALDHAHRQGIVHRDIKPDNILLDDSTGRAMLTDFGIARADSLVSTSLTQVGAVMGTPHYMSPEQATAEPQIDGRSDLYSVGVVGYQMLSGQLPFDGRSFRELLMQHVSATPTPLAQVAPAAPAELADAVMKCLAKDPAGRFPDARSLRSAVGGDAYDDESLTYELAELKHMASWLVLTVLGVATAVTSAAVSDGKTLGLSIGMWLASPLFFLLFIPQLRVARQRGYAWPVIQRVMTLPPKWWWLWWPKRWRRSGDVFERLPASLRRARVMNSLLAVLLLTEFPIMAWATDSGRLAVRELVPLAHGIYSVRWLASLSGLSAVLVLIVFLIVLMTMLVVTSVLARRVGKRAGLGHLDCNRLTYKPTDSPFWRDPRIQRVYRGGTAERRPTTPQEFVSQILASSGTLTPSVTGVVSSAAVAARRLLEAIGLQERELALLEKTAPREQLDRLEAELLLLDGDDGDEESVALLVNQRDALLRSRERLQVVSAKRDAALGELEAIWNDVRRLSVTTDGAAAKELLAQLEARTQAVERDYPRRRLASGTGAQRVTATVLVFLVAGAAGVVAQPAPPSLALVRGLLERGQTDSAIAALQQAGDTSVESLLLEGQAQSQRGSRPGVFTRAIALRRSRAAYEQALMRDSTRIEALEALAWIYRLVPSYLGGSRSRAEQTRRALAMHAPYRGQLLHGYFERLEGRSQAAEATFRQLITTSPDSAGAWFALGDLAYRQGRADESLRAWRRYRELNPTDRSILMQLGQLAAVHGVAVAEGEAALREYLRTEPRPEFPPLDLAYWRLGQILQKTGRPAEARDAYGKAIALDGRDKDYRASLRSLDEPAASGSNR